jgi:Bacterial archaeo-eukaryotic release factor family 2
VVIRLTPGIGVLVTPVLPHWSPACCDGIMTDALITFPLLRLGRLELGQGLRSLRPGSAPSGLVVTAMVEVPESVSEPQYAWDVAWADAVRQAGELGADQRTAQALAAGAGRTRADGTRVVVAAHAEVLLARWLPAGAAASSVRVGPLPHLLEVAAATARRPAHVVVLADRDSASVIAHAVGDEHPARRFPVGARPGAQRDPHPDRPPALHHGERHVTDSEPESGGERNAEFIAARVIEAAGSVDAHIALGAGDRHILDAVSEHLPGSLGPITAVAAGPVAGEDDDQLSAEIGAALDEITARAVAAVGDLVASSAAGPEPAAVRGVAAVAEKLTEQQVAVLLVAPDIALDAAGSGYRIGGRPTEFGVGESGNGPQVPLEDGLTWAALHQDAIVVQPPDRTGALAGQPAAALLRRGRP